MKKLIILTLLMSVCLVSIESKAQRRLPKQRGIQLIGGWSDGYGLMHNKKIAYYGSISLSTYTRNAHKWLLGIEYFEKRYCYNCCPIPLSQIMLEGGYFYNLGSDRGKNVFFSIGLTGLCGYETVNWGKKDMTDGSMLTNRDSFVVGGALTLEVETFLMDNLVFLFNIKERAVNSNVGTFHTQVGIGVKFIYK